MRQVNAYAIMLNMSRMKNYATCSRFYKRNNMPSKKEESTNEWESALSHFNQQLRAESFSQNTVDAYVRDIAHFFTWTLKKEPTLLLNQLSANTINQYQQMLIGIGRRATTINRRLGAIGKFAAWAKTVGLIEHDIMGEVERQKMAARQSPLGLTKPECEALLEIAEYSKHGHARRNLALIQLFLQTGVSVSEATQLQMGDFDFDEQGGVVRIRAARGNDTRTVPLNARVREALRDYIDVKIEPKPEDTFFLSGRGTMLNKRSMQHIIQRLTKAAGVTRLNVSPQTLRDTFAMNYLQQHPTNLVELATLLGHKTLGAIYKSPSMDDLTQHLESIQAV